jgi:Protein of unknown function (DUF2892)
MQCNIDAKGKAVRLVTGAVVEGLGWMLGVSWYLYSLPEWTAYAAGAAVLGGLFMVVEGAAGWCVVRAMGFRTPI